MEQRTTENRRQKFQNGLLAVAALAITVATGSGLLALDNGYQKFLRQSYEALDVPRTYGIVINAPIIPDVTNEENH